MVKTLVSSPCVNFGESEIEAQEIFDKVYEHLKTQGKPCIGQFGRQCRYISGNMRCAVGALMTEAEASAADRFGDGVYTLRNAGLLPAGSADHIRLLAELQEAHDAGVPKGTKWWEVVKLRLQKVAMDYNLSMPEP
jgi:hypothetical protein